MIEVLINPSSRLKMHARHPEFTTTVEDLPFRSAKFAQVPRIDEMISLSDGREYTVVQVWWPENKLPTIIVE
jgi:hypothetical protein